MKQPPLEHGGLRQRGTRIALIVVPILLLTTALGGILFLAPRGEQSSEFVAAKAYVFEDRGELEQAFELFRDGAIADPDKPVLHYEAGRIAERLGKLEEAKRQADLAWENGCRTRESCELMVRLHLDGTDGEAFLAQAFTWFDELPEAERSRELRGDLKFRGGLEEEAIEIWKQHVSEKLEPAVMEKLAGVLVKRERADEAWEFLGGLRSRKEFGEDGYALLAMLAAGRSIAELDEVCSEAKSSRNAGMRFKMQHAVLRLSLNQAAKARKVFESCTTLRNEEQWQASVARIFLGYLCLVEGDEAALVDLAESAQKLPASAVREGEILWYETLRKGQPEVKRLKQVLHATGGNHPAVRLFLAQTLAREGDVDAAGENYRAIGGLVAQWLPVTLGMAVVLHGQGDDMDAARLLAEMHAKGTRTEASARLLWSIADQNALGLPDGGASKKYIPAIEAILVGELDEARALLQEHSTTKIGSRLAMQADLLDGREGAVLATMQTFVGELGDWIVLAAVAERHGHWRAAERAYSAALVSRPDDIALLNNWASMKMELPEFSAGSDEVLTTCHKLHAKQPDSPVIMDTLANCLKRCGQEREAAAMFLKLGQRYRSIGQKEEALEALLTCREIQDQLGSWSLPVSRSELDEDIAILST